MNNFLDFIEKDISLKKTQIQTLPIKTKTNIKKFNETIETFETKYEEYRSGVRNYLLAKSRSFEIKEVENNKEQINDKVILLEHIKFLLNPLNTYVEKMGFDVLIYQLSNYHVFNFNSLNEIINSFLDKFELAGIHLTKDDFNYTCYVHEYMESFLEVRYSTEKKYNKVSEIFEKIYWINPDIIRHLELNFRKLIRVYSKRINEYIIKIQKETMEKNDIINYEDCLEKLKIAHIELKLASSENIVDIISKAKNNDFNIEHYLENNKVRINAFNSLIPTEINIKDNIQMQNVCQNLEKFKDNIIEYMNYLEFIPIFNYFKEEYQTMLENTSKDNKELNKALELIQEKEKGLEKLNKKIFGGKLSFLMNRSEEKLKALKIESITKTKELYELYQKYDEKYFTSKVLTILNKNTTVSDVLHLYYSFDYFKKLTIQKSYETNDYNEIIKYSSNFDLYAMDSTNIIITGVPIFDESNIPRIIANKYRLENINVTEDEVQPENLKNLLNKIILILRIKKIEESSSSIEKIWFMTWVEKMISKESNNN